VQSLNVEIAQPCSVPNPCPPMAPVNHIQFAFTPGTPGSCMTPITVSLLSNRLPVKSLAS